MWLLPTLGLFVQSWRVWSHTQLEGWWMAFVRPFSGWTLDGYRGLLNATANNTFWEGMLNSVAIAVPATAVTGGVVVTAAYALRRLVRPRRRTWWLLASVALMAFPPQMFLVPILQLFVSGAQVTIPIVEKVITLAPDTNLNGTTTAAWLAICAMSIPFGVFLVYQGMVSVPDELIDAARADGADDLTVFSRIVVPMAAPAIGAFLTLQFLWSWNEFLVPATMIGFAGSELPATVRIASTSGADGPVVAAGAFVHSAVSMAVFFVLRRRLQDGFVQSTLSG